MGLARLSDHEVLLGNGRSERRFLTLHIGSVAPASSLVGCMAAAVGPFPTAVSAPVSPGGTGSRPEPRALEPSRPRPTDRAADTDEDLARRFLLGEAAVVRWVETTVGRVVRFRGYRVPSEERHDLVQETLLETCQALARPGFAFSHGFVAFVRSIAYRRCVDWLRRRRAQDAIDPALPDGSVPADQRLVEKEERDLASEVLRDMRPACRALFRMHAGENLTYGQIARRLGRSEGALRTQMCECLREAREAFTRKRTPRPGGREGGRS